jgi:hypothetical protein
MGHGKAFLAVLVVLLAAGVAARAQEPPPEPPAQNDNSSDRPVTSRDVIAPERATAPLTTKADGHRRSDLPLEAYAVAPGTKILVGLEDELNTGETREKKRFKVRTLEPLEAGSGIYLPAGAVITGHVSRVEPAGVAGRARLYLTFDSLRARFGDLPIVAEVADVPGDKSVRVQPEHEGVVEGRLSTQQAAGQAAAEGAAMGALHGVKEKNAKRAAEGAAIGALTAYLMESGRGHELDLPKGAKLELELERALYLVKE